MPTIHMPLIKYRQGPRTMYVGATTPAALLKMLQPPNAFGVEGGEFAGTNRTRDPKHVASIAAYLEVEEEFIVGALTLYVKPGEIRFEPIEGAENEDVQLGWGHVPVDLDLVIGDGQHRGEAENRIIAKHGD